MMYGLSMEVQIKLVQDVPTRWNSTFDMLESICINKEPLTSMSYDGDKTNTVLRANMLNQDEFDTIQDLCALLSPVKELTEFLSGRKYVTCSIVYPAIYTLINRNFDLPSLKQQQQFFPWEKS